MILDNLKKFTFYSIQVRAFTTEGYGPENKLKARTGQDGMFLSYDVIDCKNWESCKILDGRLFSYYVNYMGWLGFYTQNNYSNFVFPFGLLLTTVKKCCFPVPSKPPQSITTESHVTLTTIPVAWKPIVPDHINGILLGYKIRYQAVEIGEESVEDKPIREQIVNSSTLSLVLTNLEIFILYRIDVVGFTIMGDGPPATDYAGLSRSRRNGDNMW